MNLHFLDQLQKFKPMSDFQKSPFKQKYVLISCAGVAILAAFGGYVFVNLNQQIAQQNTTIAELKSLLESARNTQVPLPTKNPVEKNSVAQETPRTANPGAPSAAKRARKKLKSMGIDASQYTPLLLEAARNGDVERLRLLVDAKAFVNSVDNEGRTVIYSAAREGHAECVKVLLSVPGVDVNKANQNGWTPLNVAANEGHAECVKLLLSAPGVDVNMTTKDGWTPLN
ncbi:MAG: ankyrin repeat domain-containing protein, partial [Akkermansia sp.]|nr:ankyrin repeat domain-containing protein [Akkermansia sp.]